MVVWPLVVIFALNITILGSETFSLHSILYNRAILRNSFVASIGPKGRTNGCLTVKMGDEYHSAGADDCIGSIEKQGTTKLSSLTVHQTSVEIDRLNERVSIFLVL